jgi:hypothetical protein
MIAEKSGPPETERHHIGGMAKYTIHPGEGGVGFEISVISDNGAKQTMLGFKTVAEADAWIAEDMRLTTGGNGRSGPDLPPAREA